MFLGGSVPPWAGGAEGDGSPPAANCGIRAVRPLRYSGLRQALREKKRKSLRNHEISVSHGCFSGGWCLELGAYSRAHSHAVEPRPRSDGVGVGVGGRAGLAWNVCRHNCCLSISIKKAKFRL